MFFCTAVSETALSLPLRRDKVEKPATSIECRDNDIGVSSAYHYALTVMVLGQNNTGDI
jgi:hypothetical protein